MKPNDRSVPPLRNEAVRMQWERVGFATRRSAKIRVEEDEVLNHLVWELSSYVLTHHQTPQTFTVHWRVPSSWWQHFKKDKYPAWALKRWPVRYEKIERTVTHHRHYAYPEVNIAPHDFGRPLLFERWEGFSS